MSNEIYEDYYLDFYDPHKCIGDLGEKWCTFKWRIYNLHLSPLETFQSPLFTTRLLPKTYWYLEVKISSPGNLRTIEISLRHLRNNESNILTLDVIYKVILNEEIKTSDKRTFVYSNDIPWDDRYCFKTPFYKSEMDYVTVECKLRPNKRMIPDVNHGNFDETLSVHFRKLLLSSELFDTVIHVGDRQLRAHYFFIRGRLPNLLNSTSMKKCGKYIIKIDDLPVSVVKEMLKYAYTGQACLDLESVSVDKSILASYSQQFSERCSWEDNPFATTFFNYETDSIMWNLRDLFKKSNVGHARIDLLRFHPSSIEFSLDVLESDETKKRLTLTFKFLGEEMPKPIIVSCKYRLSQVARREEFELGETEFLLQSNVTHGKLRLCSLLAVKRVIRTWKTCEYFLGLVVDLKICYGSSKSSIENLYKGQDIDMSQCTSCHLLISDMDYIRNHVQSDIILQSSDGRKINAHKPILIARWSEARKYKVKEMDSILIEEYNYLNLCKFLRQLYVGTGF